ncbi:FRG domain-containing protein [Enterobacter hormaechei]|uniref:FRG domain-containing protein n=1 Tax=Enterobacter hormaechei TaxID=158836 RepID=UPI0012B9656E|nr:FRG domain-containing protein [Enterobacter hormaechei]MBK1546021.1 FRG domain-containing protein [Enterobacter hormaechei]
MTSWNDFLNDIKEAENELGNPREVWYRGHSDIEWELTPTLMRLDDWENREKELFTEYSKTAAHLFEKRSNDWELLFDMQHHWLPTRLLDWTSVLGIAIAFVIHADYDDNKDSAIFVLDPTKLNSESGKDNIVNLPEVKTFDYKKIYWENDPARVDKPIAIRPSVLNDRIRAQKGVFTVHGYHKDGFNNLTTQCFKKIILPSQAKSEAREFLKWANLNEYTIYPDIVGMAKHIKRKIYKGE